MNYFDLAELVCCQKISGQNDKPGTARRRHIWVSKVAKELQSVKYSLFFYSNQKIQKLDWIGGLKGDLFGFLNSSVAKHQNNWRAIFELIKDFSEMKSHNAKKSEMGNSSGDIQSVANIKKLNFTWCWKKSFEKSLLMPKKLKRGLFGLARYSVMLKKATTLLVEFLGPYGSIWQPEVS